MIPKLFLVCLTGSAIAFVNVDYGMLTILLGVIFIIILEIWNNKGKPPKDSDPLYTENGLGI